MDLLLHRHRMMLHRGSGGGGGYTLIEYVDGDGAGTILDTGIIPNDSNYKFEADYQRIFTLGQYGTYFGTYDGESANAWRIIKKGNDNNSIYYNAYAKASGGIKQINSVSWLGDRLHITIDINHIEFEGKYSANNPSGTQGTPILTSMKLGKGRWWFFKTYRGGTLIQDLRPARDGSNTLCMVDVLTDTIYYSQYFTNGGEPI